MSFKIEDIPKHRVAYMSQIGPYGTNNQALMTSLKSWATSNDLFNESTIVLGIAHDNPDITLPENCRYDVCIVIPNEFEIKDGNICETELPGGKYAVFMIHHTAEDIQKAWSGILSELSSRGYSIDFIKPILERYSLSMVNNHLCEICVPI